MKQAAIALTDFRFHIEDYLTLRLRLNHQPSSVEAARKDLWLFYRYCRKRGIKWIKGATIVRFMIYLSKTRHNCSGTINRKQSSMRMYLRHLRLRQVNGAAEFPLEYFPRARDAYRGPVKTLEVAETQRLLTTIDTGSVLGQRDLTLYSLQYALGLRLGEALAIDLDDIDFRKRIITIHGKGRRERTLPLVPPVIEMLRSWKEKRAALFHSDRSTALFLSKKGKRLALRTAEENFQKLVAKVGPLSIEKVVPHTLRHSFASHALESDPDLLVLKAVLGHASMKSTEIYLHPSVEMQRKAVNDHLASDMLKELRTKRTGIFRIQARSKSA